MQSRISKGYLKCMKKNADYKKIFLVLEMMKSEYEIT